MGFSNKTAALFFFIFCLNLLFSTRVTAYYNPTPTPPPPPSTHTSPSPDGGLITCIGASSSPTGGAPTCPLTIASLDACINVLNVGLSVLIGEPVGQCCTLVRGLVDVEAGLCLCDALKASALIINLNTAFDLLLSTCGRNPSNARCS